MIVENKNGACFAEGLGLSAEAAKEMYNKASEMYKDKAEAFVKIMEDNKLPDGLSTEEAHEAAQASADIASKAGMEMFNPLHIVGGLFMLAREYEENETKCWMLATEMSNTIFDKHNEFVQDLGKNKIKELLKKLGGDLGGLLD